MLKNEYKKKNDTRDKSKEEYPDMPYLETEEEAAERIGDLYERRDDSKKKKKNILICLI